jgi:hypothetical protein
MEKKYSLLLIALFFIIIIVSCGKRSDLRSTDTKGSTGELGA